jgi:hypothetical protein
MLFGDMLYLRCYLHAPHRIEILMQSNFARLTTLKTKPSVKSNTSQSYAHPLLDISWGWGLGFGGLRFGGRG